MADEMIILEISQEIEDLGKLFSQQGDMNNLKPCPFCGSDAVIEHKYNIGTWIVQCSNSSCPASFMIGADYDTEEEAIEAWNRRVNYMDSKTIIEVLDTLIGATNPIGDTWVDTERMTNLKKLVDVTNWCLDGFLRVKEAPYMGERSIGDAKFLAQSAMQEWRDWLTEMLGE